ncbi:MAG: hypothetical protein KC419_21985 [Anaerolineales bacterium]|nr:hypothetical protein [Anaerolineales bacterium]
MKRIILLVAAMLLLAGCSLGQAAENTTASVGTSNEKGDGNSATVVTEEITFDSVKCDVHPWIKSRNQASVNCLLTIDKDSIKLGSDDPIELYLGGLMAGGEKDTLFQDEKPFSASGKGSFHICEGDEVTKNGLFYPCGLPVISLIAQIDGIRVPVEIVGTASAGGAEGIKIADESGSAETLVSFQCQARMIPDSTLANIIMIGEFKDGRTIAGGGIMNTNILAAGNNTPLITDCKMNGDSTTAYLGGALGDENSTVNAFSLNFGKIELTLVGEDGKSIIVTTEAMIIAKESLGFNIGMPPT